MGKKSTFSHLIIIILLGFLVYSNTFNVPFIFDDQSNISENNTIKNFKNLAVDKSARSRIIGFFTFVVNYKLHGLKVTGYHVFNLIVHLINSVLVYWLVILTFRTPFFMVRQFGKLTAHHDNAVTLSHEPVEWSKGHPFTDSPIHSPRRVACGDRFTHSPSSIALFSALIFVSHPIQTQAVTYIVQRFTSFATMFYLLSLVMYIKARIGQTAEVEVKADKQVKSEAEVKKKSLYLNLNLRKSSTLIFYFLSLISAILAMKTKEIAFTLPIVIVLYEFMFFSYSQVSVHGSQFTVHASRLFFLLPLLLTIVIIPLSLIGTDKPIGDMIGELRKAAQETKEIPRWTYLFTEFRVIVTYIRLLFLPINQNLDYDYPVYRSFFEPQVMLAFLFLLSIFGLGIYLFYRSRVTPPSPPLNLRGGRVGLKGGMEGFDAHLPIHRFTYFRLIAFGIFWFFITLSVESSIIPIRDVIFEHRMYLPSVGVIVAFSTAAFYVFQFTDSPIRSPRRVACGDRFTSASGGSPIRRFTHSPIPVYCLLTAISIFLSITTYARNSVWKDDITFWQDVIKKSPNKARTHAGLGDNYVIHGRYDDAIREYKTVLRLNPDYPSMYTNLGFIYSNMGRFDDAIKEYKMALKRNPDSDLTHFNLGNVYLNQGSLNKAIGEYQTAIRINPDFMDAHNNLGNVYLKDGRIAEAIREYQTAIRINPDYVDAHINLGIIYFEQGRLEEAAGEHRLAAKLNPDSFESHFNLGNVYFNQGHIDDAIKEYRMALRINPNSSEAYANLGRCLSRKKAP